MLWVIRDSSRYRQCSDVSEQILIKMIPADMNNKNSVARLKPGLLLINPEIYTVTAKADLYPNVKSIKIMQFVSIEVL